MFFTLIFTSLHSIPFHSISFHFSSLHFTSLHYTTLHYITSHHVTLHYITVQYSTAQYSTVRGSYSARVPRSSLAGVHREFVHHIVEEEVLWPGGKTEANEEVEENQTHNMSA